jgi:hypothetical protein
MHPAEGRLLAKKLMGRQAERPFHNIVEAVLAAPATIAPIVVCRMIHFGLRQAQRFLQLCSRHTPIRLFLELVDRLHDESQTPDEIDRFRVVARHRTKQRGGELRQCVLDFAFGQFNLSIGASIRVGADEPQLGRLLLLVVIVADCHEASPFLAGPPYSLGPRVTIPPQRTNRQALEFSCQSDFNPSNSSASAKPIMTSCAHL